MVWINKKYKFCVVILSDMNGMTDAHFDMLFYLVGD
jgi:hypothetical protein